jgi:CRISPR-associated protein Cas5d
MKTVDKQYLASFEIAGPAAMFTRPDTGSSPISYPAPTKSALKGMFECIVLSRQAYFEPLRVEICTPVVFSKYTTNYRGPLRKSGTENFQLFASILENVCYKVYGEIRTANTPKLGENSRHKTQEIFVRRLTAGQFYSTPFLGWKEFTPSYFGPVRDTTQVEQSINMLIPSMLETMYTEPTNGSVFPRYAQNLKIEGGVLNYAE